MKYSDSPQILALNRVERLYLGGAGLDKWQKLEKPRDGHNSEEFLISTVPYIGPGKPVNRGISRSKVDGRYISLNDMIHAEEKTFLGEGYLHKTCGNLGVLVRAGDSAERLIIQSHPTDLFARTYLNCPFGKTEAWYILDTRKDTGYCYVGIKQGVEKNDLIQAFKKGDSQAMLNMMHKVEFQKGEMILIPSGMLHAMGAGTTFLEFHQPCDYTFRYEKKYFERQISESELHCGLGIETVMESLRFSGCSYEELLRIVKPAFGEIQKKQGGQVETILSHDDNLCFCVERARVDRTMRFIQNRSSHCVMIAARGDVTIKNHSGTWKLLQGRGAVIPANVGDVFITGINAELLIAYPFKERGVDYGIFA